MDSLFEEVETPQPQSVRCVECAKFAGLTRDHTAWLLRIGKGYCNDDRHPGGKYNVVQSITGFKKCPLFEPAEQLAIEDLKRTLAELHMPIDSDAC